MSEPRTRSAAEVADHASDVQVEAEAINNGIHGDSSPVGLASLALSLIERLAAQVEDLAAVVAGETETTTVEILEPGELDWHGHLLAARQHLDAVIQDAINTPEDVGYIANAARAQIIRLVQAIEDGEV